MTKPLPNSNYGIGSVRQRTNGRWYWQEDFGTDPETGRRIRRSCERATREAVLEGRDLILAEMNLKPRTAVPASGTVASWLDEWLRAMKDRPEGCSPNTYTNCERACRNHIKPAIGDLRLSSLTTERVAAMLDELSAGSRTMARKTLAAAWRDAWRAGKVTDKETVRRVPATVSGFTKAKTSTREEAEAALMLSMAAPVPLSKEGMRARDQKLVLARLETERLRARWLCGMIYGGRQSEVLGLCWPDLQITATTATLSIRRSRIRQLYEHGCHVLAPCGLSSGKCPKRVWLSPYKDPKTPESIRTVTLSPGMLEILQDWQARQALELAELDDPPRIPWMFTDLDGQPLTHSADQKAWKELCVSAKTSRHYSLHSLRHTAASEAAADPTIDAQTLMGMFGWNRRQTAELYSHARDDRMAAAWQQQHRRFISDGDPDLQK